VALEEARLRTGTMHVADHQGDTIHTWDTADPRTVREIEELFREAQATGRLVYRQTSDGTGEQVVAGVPEAAVAGVLGVARRRSIPVS
jgi:hypothetical protein